MNFSLLNFIIFSLGWLGMSEFCKMNFSLNIIDTYNEIYDLLSLLIL